MNSWGQDFPGMPNQFGMPMNQMIPNMMGMMPNPMMMPEIPQQMHGPPIPDNVPPLIGPVVPEGFASGNSNQGNERDNSSQDKSQRGTSRSDNRRDRDFRDRDRNRRRSRSPRDRNDKMNAKNNRDDRGRRERRSKWDNDQNPPSMPEQGMNPGMTPGMNPNMNPGMGNMMMPGMMPHFNNNMNMMGQPQMDMQNMAPMGQMPNMVPGMNMMPPMMDQNMMMLQQMQPMPNQPLFLANGVLLPPIPGASFPNRREKPNGCRTTFVRGLPMGIKQEIITELFQRFGNIETVKLHKQGVCHVRYETHDSVEESFIMSGWRFRYPNQTDSEATTLFVDYASNRDDQAEYEKNQRKREPTPPRVEMFSPAALSTLMEKIKNDEQFAECALTLAVWLERGECSKKNSNVFYSLIQASNNQTRRLFNDKMSLDEDIDKMKTQLREKYSHIIMQFEQIAKILMAAKHQRVSDHFTKQQRRNIDMWLKMTEEVQNMKDEFSSLFDDEDGEKPGRNTVSVDKYEQLKAENETLQFELEGYKNEAYLAKDEAERKFEKFKAHFVAQNALQNKQQQYPPLPPPPMPSMMMSKPQPPPPLPDDGKHMTSGHSVAQLEAKLISILTSFLLVHPLGASLEQLVRYVQSMAPHVSRSAVHDVLTRYPDVYRAATASGEQKWKFVTFDVVKREVL